MEKKTTLIAIVLVLALVFGIGAYAYTQTNEEEIDKSTSNDINNETDNSLIQNDADLIVDADIDNEVNPFIEDTQNITPGSYISYNQSALTDNKNVIFFAASWCPTCRALDKAINSELDSIPTDLTILKADYDSEKDLKQKYKVTIQHTLVQVDQDGNMIKKWNGSEDISAIISELQ